MDDETEDLSPEEIEKIEQALDAYGAPKQEEKYSVHAFLNKVRVSSDTIKTGNLTADEVGNAELPIRPLKLYELMANVLCDDDTLSEFFKKEAEIVTSTSLSKDAKFINLAVMTNRNFNIRNTQGQTQSQNKGWFKSKQKLEEYQV